MSLVEDAAGNRFKETNTFNGETALLLGHYEQRTQGGIATHLHHIAAGGQTIAIVESKSNGTQTTKYLHRDHLGSITAITNEAGQLQERLSYDAWGKRRESNWQDATTQLTSSQTPRGYTGHEHLDDTSLIHMNGRVYDPDLGRFTRADPFVQAPYHSQSLNRYSYVLNGPLTRTDPSGYAFCNFSGDYSGYGMDGQDWSGLEQCLWEQKNEARMNEFLASIDGDYGAAMGYRQQSDFLSEMRFDVLEAQWWAWGGGERQLCELKIWAPQGM